MALLLSLLGILLFIGLILIHEYGHYKVARRNGVEVEEFGLGLPPRAWGRRLKSGMLLSLNWLPLGGFVRLKGEHDADRRKGSFGAASLWVKTKIMLAGVGMNLLAGLVLLTILAFIGIPRLIENQFTVASDTHIVRQEAWITFIDEKSPAAQAKRFDGNIRETAPLQLRDKVTVIEAYSPTAEAAANSTFTIKTTDDLRQATQKLAGKPVIISAVRNDQPRQFYAELLSEKTVAASRNTDSPKGYLGVVPTEIVIQRHTWSAPVVAVGFTKQLATLTLQGIGKALGGLGSAIAGLVTGNREARVNGQSTASAQVGGIVAIVNILWASGDLGFSFMLMIIAVLSLTLAIMNALPIPALDGGRLFVTWFFRLARLRLTRRLEERIHGTGMIVILGLFVLITIVDVKRFF